ncbi:sortase [candidate division WWE3 bacterium]|jgi:sortase A|uniref:Sortase n=1 Tax=candidate division WWE3 bacterium TaxID=2053526 RepID=A0A3A4ZJR1_UNCKA|nr:MAG: sortase [candidate division WWE3 bacterium]
MAAFKPKIYIKDESFDPIYRTVNKQFLFKSRVMPGLLLALGFIILGTQVVYPLVYFKTQDEISAPVASSVLGIASGFSDFEFTELETQNNVDAQENDVPKYSYITIPKLKIEKALVETNAPTLSPDTALGHYKGSSVPGEVGNAFIYGHSVLPWFYNPKNYKTIFSTLDRLETGDEFTIDYKDKTLKYRVEGLEILPTEKINPLAEYKPKYLNESTVTLMTCWPAGTKAKRLIVKAVLIGD